MAITEKSPWRSAKDSPSRQLLWELSRLAITRQEDWYEQLDRESQEREAVHKNALAIAVARHEQVRKDAELERDRILQLEQARQEAEARLEEERQRQARVDQEKAERRLLAERAETAARAERAATQEREAEEARQKIEKDRRDAQEAKLRKESQEAEIRRKAEAERKSKEAAIAALRSSQKTEPTTLTAANVHPITSQASVQGAERENEHQRYLQIHKTLKEMRAFMANQAKQNPKLKSRMGDMRREIKKSIGQLREGKGLNAKPTQQQASIQRLLKEAIASFPQPALSAASFTTYPAQDAQVPALLIYLLNHLSKAVVSQLIREAAVAPKIADPIGTIAVSVFANNDFRVNGQSLIDILMAKMHVVCPPLFGIYGPDNTDQGRTRLGWWREVPGGPWINDQTHQDRMTGLGAGYAALSLRNFEKSRATNPYPPYHFWQAVTAILNVPAGRVTETHLVILKALLTNSEARFMEFFGEPGKKILLFAINEYPKRAPKGSVAAVVLSNLGDALKKDKKLYL
ncbi:MAG: hypothetical protein LQ352_005037 [Teloschistes flavicans]|nr:MAG: hypothetical protein LQ352_005037 [Teloschistes flavicans]